MLCCHDSIAAHAYRTCGACLFSASRRLWHIVNAFGAQQGGLSELVLEELEVAVDSIY